MAKFFFSCFLALLCIFLSATYSVYRDPDVIQDERRKKAVFPGAPERITTRCVKRYFKEMDAFYADNLLWRESLLGRVKRIVLALDDNLNMEACFRGTDGWLFLGNRYNRTVERLEGTLPNMEEQQKSRFKYWLLLMQEVSKYGVPFVVVVCPNKSTVYPEYLPPVVVPSAQRFMEPVITELRKNGILVVDPLAELLQAKSERLLYMRSDTHWNFSGAYVAYQELAKVTELPLLPEPNFLENGIVWGDLIALGGYTNFPLREGDTFEIVWKDVPAKKAMSVWFFGDSFGEGLKPYLNAAVTEIQFYSVAEFTKVMASDAPKPDLIIWQTVERFI